jgi:FSR family fosmidomycin resistance protein-like MFS transporter
MIGLSAGHGIKHFGQSAFLIISPDIKTTFALSEIAYGSMFTAQQTSSGVANVPAGIISDMYRRRVAWILTASMMMVALGYLIIGLSPWYWLIITAVALLGFGTSAWHSPAFGTLAAHYPQRRGVAMSAHLTGAQVGDTLGPLVIGLLLGGFTFGLFNWVFDGFHWRTIAYLLFFPAALTALTVLLKLKTAGTESSRNLGMAEYLVSAKRLVANRGVLGMVVLGACRGAVHSAFLAFLVLYLKEDLLYSSLRVSMHVSLLTLAGIVSTPLMGMASDRTGRKPVIVVAMSSMALLVFMFLFFETGWPLTVLLGFLGLFFFSVFPIITAAAMDQVEKGSEASGTAMLFAGGAVIGSLSPVIAGVIYERSGFEGVVWFCGSIALVGAALAVALPVRKRVG